MRRFPFRNGVVFPLQCVLPKGCRGSAIMLVISVGALVTLLVFTWVAFSVQRYHTVIDTRDRLNARCAAESVISKAIYGKMFPSEVNNRPDSAVQIVRSGDSSTLSSIDSSLIYTDSVHHSEATATVAEEGSFLQVSAAGKSGGTSWSVDAVFGRELPDEFRYALILSEQNRQLEIRKGRIVGDVKVAKTPDGPVQGKIEAGTIVTLPQVDEGKFDQAMQHLEEKIGFPEKAEIVLQGSQAFDGQNRLPVHEGKDLFVNGHVIIGNQSASPLIIKGPLTVIATGDIQVSGNTRLEDVTLLAIGQVKCFDKVRIEKATLYSQDMILFDDEARCSGNFYAGNTIMLRGQAEVAMPSFAYVKGVLSSPKKVSGVQLSDESRFSGIAFCKQGNSHSIIERNARFTGLFYSRGSLQLEGTVFGCVAAAMLRKNAQSDRNELAGGTIDRRILPKNFTVPLAFGQQSRALYKLISWKESSSGKGKETMSP